MPRGLNTEFAIGKVDHQINSANRLSVRYMFFDNFITANVAGGLPTRSNGRTISLIVSTLLVLNSFQRSERTW